MGEIPGRIVFSDCAYSFYALALVLGWVCHDIHGKAFCSFADLLAYTLVWVDFSRMGNVYITRLCSCCLDTLALRNSVIRYLYIIIIIIIIDR